MIYITAVPPIIMTIRFCGTCLPKTTLLRIKQFGVCNLVRYPSAGFNMQEPRNQLFIIINIARVIYINKVTKTFSKNFYLH